LDFDVVANKLKQPTNKKYLNQSEELDLKNLNDALQSDRSVMTETQIIPTRDRLLAKSFNILMT